MSEPVSLEVRAAMERLELLSALDVVLGDLSGFLGLVADCDDQDEAMARLAAAYGFTEQQALVVLDMQVRRLTRHDRARVAEQLAVLTDQVGRHTTQPRSARSTYTIDLATPELYIEPADYPAPPTVDRRGPGTLLGVQRDELGNENACIWVGWTYGVVEVSVEISSEAPAFDDLDSWETVEVGTIDLPASAVLTRVAEDSTWPRAVDHVVPLPEGRHIIAVSARGRDRHRADVAISIRLWPTRMPVAVRPVKRGDTFDLGVYDSSRAAIVRHTPAQTAEAANMSTRIPASQTAATSLTDAWSRIRRIIEQRCDRSVWPMLAAGGVGWAAIEDAEQRSGVIWPTELREWFTLHGAGTGELLPGMWLLGLGEMLEIHTMQCEIWADIDPDPTDPAPAGTEAGRFLPQFIPIAERDGTMLICDTRPGRYRGCVTEFGKDTADMSAPGWESLSALITDLGDSLEHGTPFAVHYTPSLDSDGISWEFHEGPTGQ
ncbi:SMI1/KNR4 family protein [Nocardia sp. NPDC058658]|uniref:SMI1/KNR4 family protein n=1 Tax=Nocardia sp. NPDC058658 TaxID=3346580 RepID=UPI0036668E45